MEMIPHDAPAKQLYARKLRRPAGDLQEILAFVIFQKIDAVRYSADKMMHSFVFFYSVVRM